MITKNSLDTSVALRLVRPQVYHYSMHSMIYVFQSSPELFGVIKTLETALANVSRIMLLWDSVADMMKAVANHKIADIRRYGVDCLAQLVVAAIHSICRRRQQFQTESNDGSYILNHNNLM